MEYPEATRVTALLFLASFGFAQSTSPEKPRMVEKEIPASFKSSLMSAISKLIECERREDWSCRAEFLSAMELQGKTKNEWVQERKRRGSFFGKRLQNHRLESIYSYGFLNDDERTSAMIFGCAQLRGKKQGYQTEIDAFREQGEWRFIGPYTVSQIGGPPYRCRF
jgi:hypothetical protein